jgi:regulatory protein YycI of two-component signal transduction system YycFG
MDWTKAKSILIVALLITNLIIGMAYHAKISEEKSRHIAAAQSTQTYLAKKGITLDVEIPGEVLRKPVLFVRFQPPEEGEKKDPVYYDGMLVEASQDNENVIVPLSYGETRRGVLSASYALLKFLSFFEEEQLQNIHVTGIELIYFVDTASTQKDISEDTAAPTWKITTQNNQSFYINAYGE